MVRRKDRPRRPNATGRNDKSGRFVALPHRVLESAAYASLDLVARGLLTELVMLFKGDNNGSLYLSASDATARLGLSDKRPALRAFDDLQERGLITLAKDAHFAVKASDASRARCWRLAWHAWPECPSKGKRGPTYDWEHYQPAGDTPASRRAHNRLQALAKYRKDQIAGRLPGVKSTPMEPILADLAARPGVKSTPAIRENDAIPPFPIGVESSPYLDDTIGMAGRCWWSSQLGGQFIIQILALQLIAQNRPPIAEAA